MNEGKKLLYSIIENKLNRLTNLDTDSLFIDDINLKELSEKLEQDDINFYLVSDNIIEKVIEYNNLKTVDKFKKDLISARDLLIGKKDYNLKINLNQDHTSALNKFKKNLNRIVNNIDSEILYKDELIKRIKDLKRDMDYNYLINDFELIEDMTRDYDKLNYDNNMIIIMKYINDFNLTLLKTPKRNSPKFDIHLITKPKIDQEIKDILKRLEITQKEIPNYLLSELKKCDVEEFVHTFNTIKKNKAENGGILHFIDKENKILILSILLYANEKSIKGIISTIEDENGYLDINLLKIIINNIPSSLLVKNNTYFNSLHKEYMNNYKLLKDLKVNYSILIKKTPLFMIMKNDTLDYTLNYLSQYGASKKDIINRCYKTLVTTPSLMIDNLEIMKKYNININEFFADSNTNYNLLKIIDLDKKLAYLKKTFKIDLTDITLLNKVIVAKVYQEATSGFISWGE
ncbi:MAG: hypothetical protein J1F35_03120 [Erysipelotrichales bacterium]|nr:hypothetical protein [Erysipelotrichales bacterium]